MDWEEVAGEAGLVIGTAFFGIEGNCFFAEPRRGLVRSSPLKVFSSVSDLCQIKGEAMRSQAIFQKHLTYEYILTQV